MTAPIRSMPELIEALRARRDALNISHETIDAISGLQAGYTSKLLAPQPIKGLGAMSLGALMGALAVGLLLVDDPEQRARVEPRWQKRKRPQKLIGQASQASIAAEVQENPAPQPVYRSREFMKRISKLGASKGGKRRAQTMSKRARQRAATHAARMRWAKAKCPGTGG